MTAIATDPASTSDATVERVDVSAYEIPTDGPGGAESDGTLEWRSTTVVAVELRAGGEVGLGYTYGPAAVAALVEDELAGAVLGADPLAVRATWDELRGRLRNAGRPGIGAMALAAVDVALWDLAARLVGLPLVDLLGRARDAAPLYGSGGFCNYPLGRLRDQLGGWVEQGIPRVKLKVARRPEEDALRLDAVRREIGEGPELYVDANGALSRTSAVAWARRFAAEWGVSWLEEPVSSDDREGLRLVRDRGPGGLDVAAGEYVYLLRDAVDLLEARAVDCLQLDVTRCGGITGLLEAAAAAAAYEIDVSGHCAPQLAAHALCAVPRLRHLEWFHDHVRSERLLLDGCLEPGDGALRPDRSRPGHGLKLRRPDAEKHRIRRRRIEREEAEG